MLGYISLMAPALSGQRLISLPQVARYVHHFSASATEILASPAGRSPILHVARLKCRRLSVRPASRFEIADQPRRIPHYRLIRKHLGRRWLTFSRVGWIGASE